MAIYLFNRETYGLNRDWYKDERRDPVKATHAACNYLKDLYKEFDNWYLALAAYNCGSGRVARASKLHQTYDFWQMHSLPRRQGIIYPIFFQPRLSLGLQVNMVLRFQKT